MKRIILLLAITLTIFSCGSSDNDFMVDGIVTVDILKAGGDVTFYDPYQHYNYTLNVPADAVEEDVTITIKFYADWEDAPVVVNSGSEYESLFEIISDDFKFVLDVPYTVVTPDDTGDRIIRYSGDGISGSWGVAPATAVIEASESNEGFYAFLTSNRVVGETKNIVNTGEYTQYANVTLNPHFVGEVLNNLTYQIIDAGIFQPLMGTSALDFNTSTGSLSISLRNINAHWNIRKQIPGTITIKAMDNSDPAIYDTFTYTIINQAQ